jgi:hypothetical protein
MVVATTKMEVTLYYYKGGGALYYYYYGGYTLLLLLRWRVVKDFFTVAASCTGGDRRS